MENQNTKIQELQEQITKLQSQLNDLSGAFYRNNFTSSQTFNKSIIFTDRLKVPHYTSAPSVGEIGDILEVGGKLYVCTTSGNIASPAVFTLVGSQV
jgi:hypothetical protein